MSDVKNGDAAPAVIVRMVSQVGPNRSLELQFGIPLDMSPKDLNAYLDRISACSERQNNKGILEAVKLQLKSAYRDLETNTFNRAGYESKQAMDHVAKGKRGEWKPDGGQVAQIRNFDTTESNIRENIIPRLQKEIDELEVKINEAS